MTTRIRKSSTKQLARNAWLVRWVLVGRPSVLPVDMFCTIPGAVLRDDNIFWLANHCRIPDMLLASSVISFLRKDSAFDLIVPVSWPCPARAQLFLCKPHGPVFNMYRFPTLEIAHRGTQQLILAAAEAGLV